GERARGTRGGAGTARGPSADRVGQVRGAGGRRAPGEEPALGPLRDSEYRSRGVSRGAMVLERAGVSKLFGSTPAVDGASLEIRRGEVFTLLGPSGCGKTTTLRLVAGLERPDAGEITLRGRVVASAARRVFVAPHKRNLGMVFQSYAIWPHMTVFDNVAYPLTLRGTSRAVIREKVTRVLDLVGLDGLQRRPASRPPLHRPAGGDPGQDAAPGLLPGVGLRAGFAAAGGAVQQPRRQAP